MEILVCVKRVPTVGGTITLTGDGLSVDTRMSGFTISPHEECAVEEAVRLCERFGGSVTVVSLGPASGEEQLALLRAHPDLGTRARDVTFFNCYGSRARGIGSSSLALKRFPII